MKKVLIGLLSIILIGQMAYAQPVSDNAVIPMAITVNSILRLNVIRGGNVEFVFNNLDDYANGLFASTDVTIASSGNWTLSMLASTTDFFDIGAATGIPLNYVAFNLTSTGNHTIGTAADDIAYYPNGALGAAETDYSFLVNTAPANNILGSGAGNAGGIADNAFTINWECGTGNTFGLISTAGVTSGRYSTNILLSLSAL